MRECRSSQEGSELASFELMRVNYSLFIVDTMYDTAITGIRASDHDGYNDPVPSVTHQLKAVCVHTSYSMSEG